MSINDCPTSVYQYFDEAGELLYVGITARGSTRGYEHSRTKPWWPLVASSTVKHFATRQAALLEEAYLIKFWRPPHNTAGRPSGPPRHVRPIATIQNGSEGLRVPITSVRSLLGRLGRVASIGDLPTALIDAEFLPLIEAWKAEQTTVEDARHQLAALIRKGGHA